MEHTFDNLLFRNMPKRPFYVQCFIKYTKNDFMGELDCQVNLIKKTINTYRKMAPLNL